MKSIIKENFSNSQKNKFALDLLILFKHIVNKSRRIQYRLIQFLIFLDYLFNLYKYLIIKSIIYIELKKI